MFDSIKNVCMLVCLFCCFFQLDKHVKQQQQKCYVCISNDFQCIPFLFIYLFICFIYLLNFIKYKNK